MSATRWNTLNLMNWLEAAHWEDEQSSIPEWGVEQILPPANPEDVGATGVNETGEPSNQPHLPEILPILPLRGLVV